MNYNYQQEKSTFLCIINEKRLLKIISQELLNELLLVRRILLLAINRKSYNTYKKNQEQLIMILALLSLKEEILNAEEAYMEVAKRMALIKKYFEVDSPSISESAVYFKPDLKKIEMLIKNLNY